METWRFVMIYILVAVVLIGGVITAAYFCDKAACHSQASQMGIDWQYGIWQGCMLNIGNQWIPKDNYRKMED